MRSTKAAVRFGHQVTAAPRRNSRWRCSRVTGPGSRPAPDMTKPHTPRRLWPVDLGAGLPHSMEDRLHRPSRAVTSDPPAIWRARLIRPLPVSYTHLRAHETVLDLVCRLLLEKK